MKAAIFVLVFLTALASAETKHKKHKRKPASRGVTSQSSTSDKSLRRQLNTLPTKRNPDATPPTGMAAPGKQNFLPSTEGSLPSKGTIYSPINLSAGTNFGLNYLFTTLHIQWAFFHKWVIGAMPVYSSSSLGSTTANAIGLLGTVAYYPKSYFEGLFFQLGVGFASISAASGAVTEKKSSVLGNVLGGWRFNLIPHLNLGFGAGVQYATDPTLVLVDINFRSFRPVFMADLGYNF